MTRGRTVALVAAAAGVAGVASAWLQWTASGSANRNSYESLRSAQRLGLDQFTSFRIVWFLVPVAVLALLFLLAARLQRPAGIVGVVIGLVLVGFGAGVLSTPVAGGPGPWLSCLAGFVTGASSAVLIAQGSRRS